MDGGANSGDFRGRTDSRDIQLDEMVTAAKTGSNSALGRALSACRPQLLRAARRRLVPALRPVVGASDLVQDAFVNATKAFGVFRGDRGNQLMNWLRRILFNRIAQIGRGEGQNGGAAVSANGSLQRTITLLPSAEDSPSTVVGDREHAEMIRAGLARLTERDQQVLRLRFDEELNFAQIGQRLELSEDAARLAFTRAVRRLRQEMSGLTAGG